MNKNIVGYTSGVYDMLHIGHLNVIKRAKELCDYLIVGVSTDEVVIKNKNKTPIISFEERAAIVSAIKYVDKVVPQERYDIEGKIETVKKYGINVMFVGSDWEGTDKWNRIEEELAKIGCKVVYLPHTDGISSTMLRQKTKMISDFSDIIFLGCSPEETNQLFSRQNSKCWVLSNIVIGNIIYTDGSEVLSIDFKTGNSQYVIEAKVKCKTLGFDPNDRLDTKMHEIEIDLNRIPTISLLFDRCGDISFEAESIMIMKVERGKKKVLSSELERLAVSDMEKIKIIKGEVEIYYGTILCLKDHHKAYLDLELTDDIKFVKAIGLMAAVK